MTAIDRPEAMSSHKSVLRRVVRTLTGGTNRLLGWLTGSRHWTWGIALLAAMVITSMAVVFASVTLTPAQSVDALGQHFTVSAGPATTSVDGHGEITVNTGSPQTFPLLPTHYYGPARLHLTVDAPFQGSESLNKAAMERKLPPQTGEQFKGAIVAWIWRFGLMALVFGAGAGLILAAFVMLLKRDSQKKAGWLAVRTTIATLLNAAIVVLLLYTGSSSMASATSLDQLVGHSTLHLSPPPMGPKVTGYDAVSIGDSRAATQGGKAIKGASKEDQECERSSDSLAAQIGRMENWRVLNLACSAATIPQGLMGPQQRGSDSLLPQMSVVQQMTNIRAVFVTIGPNDLWWSRAIGLCYVADVCNDNLTGADYVALLQQFDWNYHDLLVQLQELHNGPHGSHPLIVINGSYDVISPTATCPDVDGLTPAKITMLSQRNSDLNQALQQGAGTFGFIYLKPQLKLLCSDLSDSPGPDIRGPHDPNAFHPTDIGVSVIAMQDVLALAQSGVTPFATTS